MKLDKNMPFYDIYGYDLEDFKDVKIEDVEISRKLRFMLKRSDVNTLSDLLKLNYEDLKHIKGFGEKCFSEILQCFNSINSYYREEYKELPCSLITDELAPYKNNIIRKDFSFVRNINLSELSRERLERYIQAYELIDPSLINCCINGNQEIQEIIQGMSNYIKVVERCYTIKNKVKDRLNKRVSYFIKAFSSEIMVIRRLEAFIDNSEMSLDMYISKNKFNIGNKCPELIRFLNWCDFNVKEEVSIFFRDLFKDKRLHTVVKLRAESKTLQEVGNEVGLTRERVRQIEIKTIKKVQEWQNSFRILLKINADCNGQTILVPEQLMNCFETYYNEAIYLLKGGTLNNITYDRQLDAFVIGDHSVIDKVKIYIDELPDVFQENEVTKFIRVGNEERELPYQVVERAIKQSFDKTGITYHRIKLTLTWMYENILSKYYGEGMHIYNDKDMDIFRGLLVSEYGEVKLPMNNRAIAARIADIGVLCGRGKYKPKQDRYISEDLANKIHNYITDCDSPIFLINIIFDVFKEELILEGIDNKYYLQGVLKDLYGNEFVFRRDYISKDETITSMYNEIINFIKKHSYPVSKQAIYDAFPGVTDIVVAIAVDDSDIINLLGNYLHSDRLKLNDFDIKYLKKVVERFVVNNRVCHCKDIYEFVSNDNPIILSNNGVFQSYSIFSLLEFIFGNEFNFSRPYIAEQDIKIDKAIDILKDMVVSSTIISIDEISFFARTNYLQINSILEFINSCNETHLLINDKEIATFGYIGINYTIAKYVEEQVKMEVMKPIAISELTCIHRFTNLNVPWNEWLIYSILLKWSTDLEVIASSSQFRQSIPLVALKGEMDSSIIQDINSKNIGSLGLIDDLNDIDELIEEYIIEELGEELNEL